jgi:hypothetical protein
MRGAGLAYDEDGRLYDQGFRAMFGAGLADDQRARVEALLALRSAAFSLDEPQPRRGGRAGKGPAVTGRAPAN